MKEESSTPSEYPKVCFFCNGRINLVSAMIKCSCKQVFCERHRPPKAHKCEFDFVAKNKAQLERKLVDTQHKTASELKKDDTVRAMTYKEFFAHEYTPRYRSCHGTCPCRQYHAYAAAAFVFFFILWLSLGGLLVLTIALACPIGLAYYAHFVQKDTGIHHTEEPICLWMLYYSIRKYMGVKPWYVVLWAAINAEFDFLRETMKNTSLFGEGDGGSKVRYVGGGGCQSCM
eukprot:GFYU01009269.1.p1 GENE.GFYU01009269.1~~GFYU01009269.1.p1  ORF type:complete len:230 (-),score=53.33 GFYU01009269.1:82-771(-)